MVVVLFSWYMLNIIVYLVSLIGCAKIVYLSVLKFSVADNPAPKLSLEVSSNEFFILGVHLSYIIVKRFHLKLIE